MASAVSLPVADSVMLALPASGAVKVKSRLRGIRSTACGVWLTFQQRIGALNLAPKVASTAGDAQRR